MRRLLIDCLCSALLLSGLSFLEAQNAGKEYYDEGNYLKAIAEFEAQLQAQAQFNPGLYFYLGNSYQALGRLSGQLYRDACYFGNLYYEDLEARGAKNFPGHYYRGLCLWGLKKIAEAKSAFAKAVKHSPKPYSAFAAAWLDLLNGNVQPPAPAGQRLEYALARREIHNAPADISPDFQNSGELSAPHGLYNYVMLLIGQNKTEQADQMLQKFDYRLLDAAEQGVAANSAIEYSYYHPLALKYLSRHFYKKALAYYLPLEKRVSDPEQRRVVRRKIGRTYAEMDSENALAYLKNEEDPALKNFYARLLWESGDRESAKAIWAKNLAADAPEARAYAGYCLAAYAGQVEEGLTACRKAHRDAGEDQEIAVLLGEIYYSLKNDLFNAALVLEAARSKSAENDPLFWPAYAKIMYASGPNRFNDALYALHLLQQNNEFARQLHYYVQGLVAARIKTEGRTGNESGD